MKKIILSVAAIFFSSLMLQAKEPIKKDFQLSFITPLGTNGIQSQHTLNNVSLNILGGYSYGTSYFELAGLYNINTCHTSGVQIAGITNITGNGHRAVQIAGITNIATNGSTAVQVSGILNVAKRVSGVQIGLFNYAEESDGVSIGLINVVKNGGKREFEVSFSEALNTALSFKLGTDRFYTIFSGGISYLTPSVEYGFGLGFGSHINWKKGWGNQIEAIAYSVTENGHFKEEISMLTQLKFTVSKQIAPHFKLFLGPTWNVSINNTLASWSMWSNTSSRNTYHGWVGFAAGVRF